jgi:hypothetical protein
LQLGDLLLEFGEMLARPARHLHALQAEEREFLRNMVRRNSESGRLPPVIAS